MPDGLMDTLLQKYVIDGGIVMIPLMICSLLVIGFTLQGLIRLRRRRVMPPDLVDKARAADSATMRRPFIMAMRGHPSPLGRAIWFTLKEFAHLERVPELGEIDHLVEEGTSRAVDEMYDGLGSLQTLYTVAPLLGLLGTILGMVQTFYQFGVAEEKSIETLAVGIQEALITTLWGLPIAILAYLAAQWLEGKIRRYERYELPMAVRECVVTLYAPAPESEKTTERIVTNNSIYAAANKQRTGQGKPAAGRAETGA